MKSHKIEGANGARLHVVETGNPKGRPILFIHGFSQSSLAWSRQMNSELAEDFRLVAMDLRGHGWSDKPRDESYVESRCWAEDVNAVIRGLNLDHPVLSGWSYGPLIILDYLRHFGEDYIGGFQFVGGVTKLGSDEAISVLTPEFLALIPGFFSEDAEESVKSLGSLLRLCFKNQLDAEDFYRMLGYNVSVPAYVRQAMFSRSFDNDDLMPSIRKPVLITHSAEDAVVKPTAVEQHKLGLTHAQIHMMENVGHGCFWDDAPSFNARLRTFTEER
jgi:pimeloyl-ACP methyl ester carboxylesterase